MGFEIVPPFSTTVPQVGTISMPMGRHFGFPSSYTEVLQGGTISMSTGRHVNN